MTAENNFDKLRSMVHQGVALEKMEEKTAPIEKEGKPLEPIAEPIVSSESAEMEIPITPIQNPQRQLQSENANPTIKACFSIG